LLQT